MQEWVEYWMERQLVLSQLVLLAVHYEHSLMLIFIKMLFLS